MFGSGWEWVTGLGLSFNNCGGTWGKWAVWVCHHQKYNIFKAENPSLTCYKINMSH